MKNKTNSKAWYKSKTIWINILLGIICLFSQSIIPGFPIAWATAIVAICNIILRIISSSPIDWTAQAKETYGDVTRGKKGIID